MLKSIALTLGILVVCAAAWFGYTQFRYYTLPGDSQDVRFTSADGTILSGTLTRPRGAAVTPAAVILHGAGRESRNGPGYRAHARAMLKAGVAVLLYDKRGTGESGGEFAASGYGDFIADARAAIDYLAQRPDIDAGRIGLVGASESGWFTPELAAGGGVAFVVNKAGPPMSWIDTAAYETRNDMIADGLTADEASRRVAAMRAVWLAMRGAAAAEQPAAAHARLDEALAALRSTVADPETYYAQTLRAVTGADPVQAAKILYDPTPWLESLEVPALYLLAENDPVVPAAESAAVLEALRARGMPVELRVIPDVGHTFYHWTGALTGLYPPGYLSGLTGWVRQTVAGI